MRQLTKGYFSGFTIIEMLVVISVIIILAGITVGIISYANDKAFRDRTTVELRSIEMALQQYHNDVGQYPDGSYNSPNGLYGYLGTTTNAAGRRLMSFKDSQFSSTNLIDPYGNIYGYQSPGSNNLAGFDLWSTTGAGASTNSANVQAYINASTNTSTTNGIARWIGNWRR